MAHTIVDTGGSRSFPGPHALLRSAGPGGDVLVLIGTGAGMALAAVEKHESLKAVLIELGTECLGVHTGERRGGEGSNVLGFARFRLGDGPPSDLVELVRQPGTKPESIATAKTAFESAGLHVAVCMDTPGRIVDRLVRPYYNGALRKLDEGLATADDLDTTLRLGLGYPEGPIALLERTGLAHHHDVTKALHDALADPGFAPARRAQVAKRRQKA